MDKRKITAFSKAAKTYDEYAWLQGQMWGEILLCLKYIKPSPKSILDIGMGTGEHTYELTLVYPGVYTVGFDIAWGMVKYAAIRKSQSSNGTFVLQADLNKMPFKESIFDLAVSNVVYQRMPHLVRAFLDVKRVLRPKGFFSFSLTTEETLHELHRSFEEAYRKVKGSSLPPVYDQPSGSIVLSALKEAGFSIVSIKNFRKCPAYKTTYEVLKWLKATGTNHHYNNWICGIGGRTILEEMDRIYRERYSSDGKIYATLEGLIITARKMR